MKEKLIRIISYYKPISQLKKLNEENYELVEAIRNLYYFENDMTSELRSKDFKKRREYLVEHVIEEIADCYVMIEQFRQYYNISNEYIEDVFKYKVNRTIKKIEKEKKDRK